MKVKLTREKTVKPKSNKIVDTKITLLKEEIDQKNKAMNYLAKENAALKIELESKVPSDILAIKENLKIKTEDLISAQRKIVSLEGQVKKMEKDLAEKDELDEKVSAKFYCLKDAMNELLGAVEL